MDSDHYVSKVAAKFRIRITTAMKSMVCKRRKLDIEKVQLSLKPLKIKYPHFLLKILLYQITFFCTGTHIPFACNLLMRMYLATVVHCVTIGITRRHRSLLRYPAVYSLICNNDHPMISANFHGISLLNILFLQMLHNRKVQSLKYSQPLLSFTSEEVLIALKIPWQLILMALPLSY